MASMRRVEAIRVGLIAEEPMRLAGLVSIFEEPPQPGQAPLVPILGTLDELLTTASLEYLVVDLGSSPSKLAPLATIRRQRADIHLIVIGPVGNDEMVMETIIAGARGYLDLTASPQIVRQAIEAVTSGDIWAPRRLLSKLVDRLLTARDSSLTSPAPQLTAREREVMELILKARSNREIAHDLGIEERTVKGYVSRLMRKSGVDNRIELSMRALHRAKAPHSESTQLHKLEPSHQLFTN